MATACGLRPGGLGEFEFSLALLMTGAAGDAHAGHVPAAIKHKTSSQGRGKGRPRRGCRGYRLLLLGRDGRRLAPRTGQRRSFPRLSQRRDGPRRARGAGARRCTRRTVFYPLLTPVCSYWSIGKGARPRPSVHWKTRRWATAPACAWLPFVPPDGRRFALSLQRAFNKLSQRDDD